MSDGPAATAPDTKLPNLLPLPGQQAVRLVALRYLDETVRAAARLGDADDDDALHDFRVSVRKLTEFNTSRVVLSTAVSPHNFFGKAYLFVILPFHRMGARMLVSNAVKAGRL